MDSPPRIIVVGGGAGGLELVTRLGNQLGRRGRAEVTLVDAEWTHVWKPLLHEVAAGSLDVGDNALEFMAQARRHHFRFRLGYVEDIDRSSKEIRLSPMHNDQGEQITPRRTLPYDILVLAVGSITNDLGVDGVGEHCLFLDTTRQAERFQQTLLGRMLRAHAQGGPSEPSELDVAIVGGGATGVELSAQLHDVTRQLAAYGLDELRPDEHIRLHVIQAGRRLVPALPERLSVATAQSLERLGVEVHCNCRVSKVTPEGVYTDDGDFIPAAIKVWAAGIKAPEWLANVDGLETTHSNQIRVERTLQTTTDPHIFAMGDCAACPTPDASDIVPPRAQAAHQQAAFLVRALRAYMAGRTLPLYRYRDYGSLIALGRYTTVGSLMGAVIGSISISGTFARLIYLWLYQSHRIALHGWTRTLLLNLANLLRRGVDPRIKLH